MAAKLARDNGVPYDPGTEILATTGATLGLACALTALVGDGDEVLLPDPIYDAYHSPIALAGGRVAARPRADRATAASTLTGRGARGGGHPGHARAAAQHALESGRHRVPRATSSRRIAAFVVRRDLLLISDEIYETIVFDGHRHISPGQPVARACAPRTILVNSLSKTYAMTGWRVGYCAAPAPLIQAMFLVLQQSSRGPATFVQDAAAAALTGPQELPSRDARRVRRAPRAGASTALPAFPTCACCRPRAASSRWWTCAPPGCPRTTSGCACSSEHGVVVAHGSAYGPGGEGTLRVSFASGGDNLARGLERLRAGLSQPVTLLKVERGPAAAAGATRPAWTPRRCERALGRETTAEVRFDTVSRALYSTDASVYQIEPLGVVLPRTREDLVAIVRICARLGCPLTMRGGGTSQAGQAIGDRPRRRHLEASQPPSSR